MQTQFKHNLYIETEEADEIVESLTVTIEFDPASADEYGIDCNISSVKNESGEELWIGVNYAEKVENLMTYKRSVSPEYYAEGEYFSNIDNWAKIAVSEFYEKNEI